MHYKEQHTDNELLEGGWLQMQDRLERELPQQRKSDKWLYLVFSILLLAGSAIHVHHTHEVEPNAITKNAIQKVDEENSNGNLEIEAVTQNEINTSEVIQQPAEERGVLQSSVAKEEPKFKESPIQNQAFVTEVAEPVGYSERTALSQTIVPNYSIQQPTIYNSEINQRTVANSRIATTPFVSTRNQTISISNEDNTLGKSQEMLSLSTLLPIKKYDLFVPERSLPNTEYYLLKERAITPFISVGLLRNFTVDMTGLHIGFGLNHQLKTKPRLSLKYLVSTNYLFNFSPFSTSEERDASVADNGVPEVFEEGVVEEESIDYNEMNKVESIDTYYQLSASVIGYYRLHHRISIGIGGSLTYQDFKFSSRVDALQVTRDNIDIHNQFAGIAYLSTPIHLTPRLSLEPYCQYQLTSGEIKVNQAGLNVTFGLTK